MLNFQSEILCARQWENLIVVDVKLSKWDFNFYCRLLNKISVVYSKFQNDVANILCSALNNRLLKPSILKFSFMFIEFRYNLSFRVCRILLQTMPKSVKFSQTWPKLLTVYILFPAEFWQEKYREKSANFRDGIDQARHAFARFRFSTDRLCTRIIEHRIDCTRHDSAPARLCTNQLCKNDCAPARLCTNRLCKNISAPARLCTNRLWKNDSAPAWLCTVTNVHQWI